MGLWRETSGIVEERRSRVEATVRTTPDVASVLTAQFGRNCVRGGPGADGRVVVTLRARLAIGLAERLAGWGDRLEVLGPAEVRRHLSRIGAELVRRYPETGIEPIVPGPERA